MDINEKMAAEIAAQLGLGNNGGREQTTPQRTRKQVGRRTGKGHFTNEGAACGEQYQSRAAESNAEKSHADDERIAEGKTGENNQLDFGVTCFISGFKIKGAVP